MSKYKVVLFSLLSQTIHYIHNIIQSISTFKILSSIKLPPMFDVNNGLVDNNSLFLLMYDVCITNKEFQVICIN
jgi:hypothetical protein